LKSWESSQTESKILITHEILTQFYMPQVIENTDCDKPTIERVITSMGTDKSTTKCAATEKHITEIPSTRSKISIAHEETSGLLSARPHISIAHGSKYKGNIDKYTTTENQGSLNDKLRSKISNTHEQPVLKIICRDKPPTVKSKMNMVPRTGMNTKYATATEQSSYIPTPIINDNPVNNKSFCSQYLQTVLITTNNNGNNNSIFYGILISSLYKSIISPHPFIAYLQPEPEPPPLKSYFILLYFYSLERQQNKKWYYLY
jgi:hypothetical protein